MTKQKKTNKTKNVENSSVKKWYYFILVFLPVILILLFEIILRIIGYGQNPKEWVNLTDKIEILNPEISQKYFSGIKNPPFSTESFLLKNKPINSFRIIVLGASSGAGYPYQNSGSFSKYLRKSLSLTFPEKKIEVANISMAAINSYTILDLLPGVLEKEPDLILVYLGHNEYYGALGVGSSLSAGSSRFFKILFLKLYQFRTFQLLRNLILSIDTVLSLGKSIKDGTLMSKIVNEKLIEYDSDLYKSGIKQYKENLREIFQLCEKVNVPIIIGTLSSNLKDLPPFNSIKTGRFEPAEKVYKKAQKEFKSNNIKVSDSLFRKAKDLDGLRFRAPEKFNKIITTLAEQFNFVTVNIDSFLNKKSKYGIIGNDLMTDHLHPSLKGYQLIGNLFYRKIVENNYVENRKIQPFQIFYIDSLVKSQYNFTKFDSTISSFRIKILKNDWPYIQNGKKKNLNKLLSITTLEGKVAKEVLDGKISRKDARVKLISNYFENKNYKAYANQVLAMTEEFPLDNSELNKAAENLIKLQKYKLVENLLNASYRISADPLNTKWLGIMYLSNGNLNKAKMFLKKSNTLNSLDPQVLFNLSGVYLQLNDYTNAYKFITKCLEVSPNYRNAKVILSQIKQKLNIK